MTSSDPAELDLCPGRSESHVRPRSESLPRQREHYCRIVRIAVRPHEIESHLPGSLPGPNGTRSFQHMDGHPISRISRVDLERLMATLDVRLIKLSECLIGPGSRLALEGADSSEMHHALEGSGRMIIGREAPIDLLPHTLVVVPPGQSVRVEAPAGHHTSTALATVRAD